MRNRVRAEQKFLLFGGEFLQEDEQVGKVDSGGLCIRGKQVVLVMIVLVLRSVQVLICEMKCEL